jgi:hypothetical protein
MEPIGKPKLIPAVIHPISLVLHKLDAIERKLETHDALKTEGKDIPK